MTGAGSRAGENSAERTADGIYGVIVSAAVLAASHGDTAAALSAAVLVTLLVYWAAERYARLLAERIHEGHRPGLRRVWRSVTTGWEMVTASLVPLGVLLVLRLSGRDLDTAVTGALAASSGLLFLAGWRAGSGGRLTARERLVSAVVAGAFGGLLILAKSVLH